MMPWPLHCKIRRADPPKLHKVYIQSLYEGFQFRPQLTFSLTTLKYNEFVYIIWDSVIIWDLRDQGSPLNSQPLKAKVSSGVNVKGQVRCECQRML